MVDSAASEPRLGIEFRDLPIDATSYTASETNRPTVAFVSIAASDGERLGTLCLIRKKAPFTSNENRVLQALASHAALITRKLSPVFTTGTVKAPMGRGY